MKITTITAFRKVSKDRTKFNTKTLQQELVLNKKGNVVQEESYERYTREIEDYTPLVKQVTKVKKQSVLAFKRRIKILDTDGSFLTRKTKSGHIKPIYTYRKNKNNRVVNFINHN